jgi:hypothetical protein
VVEYSTASAHIGSDSNRLQVFADRCFNDTPHLQAGSGLPFCPKPSYTMKVRSGESA